MSIDTLHDLMVHELKDLINAERQLVKALPKMASNATSPDLQQALTDHLEQTKVHVTRLEDALETLGESIKGLKCRGMEGLIEEGESLLDEEVEPEVLDAGIIASAQRVEHYEIAAYGTAAAYARSMRHDDVAALLEQTLAEEMEADELLTSIAERMNSALVKRDGLEEMGLDEDSDEESDDEIEEEGEDVTAEKRA